jgi:hypothetical protein
LTLLRAAAPGWRWSFAVAGFLVVDLTIAGYGLNPSAPRSLFEGETALAREIGADHRTLMPSDLEYELKFWRFFRFDGYDSGVDWALVREAGLPNTLLLEGISSADNFDPLQPARYMDFREALESLAPSRQEPLLALMDVGWRAAEDPSRLEGVRYEPVAGPDRLRMVPTARWTESPAQALQIVMSEEFRPDLEVVLEGAPPEGVPMAGTSGSASLAADEGPNRLRVSAESTGGSWLVVSDVVYPGWEATVDGAPSAIYPADSLFRAVWVPAGSHEVVFEYRPVSVLLGALLSLASLGFVVAVGFRWRAA